MLMLLPYLLVIGRYMLCLVLLASSTYFMVKAIDIMIDQQPVMTATIGMDVD